MNIRYLTVISLLLATLQCFGQKDVKARQVLDAMAAEYDKAAGTEIVFDGSVKGTIALKGNKFVLDSGLRRHKKLVRRRNSMELCGG